MKNIFEMDHCASDIYLHDICSCVCGLCCRWRYKCKQFYICNGSEYQCNWSGLWGERFRYDDGAKAIQKALNLRKNCKDTSVFTVKISESIYYISGQLHIYSNAMLHLNKMLWAYIVMIWSECWLSTLQIIRLEVLNSLKMLQLPKVHGTETITTVLMQLTWVFVT